MVNKTTKKVICTSFSNRKRHKFKVFKESKTNNHASKKEIAETGYQELQKIHNHTEFPKNEEKKSKLTKKDKMKNQKLASHRILNENVIGMIKRFRIVSERYRNRRKRFGL